MNKDFIKPEDVRSITDYLQSLVNLADSLSRSIAANKIVDDVKINLDSSKLREKEIINIMERY